MRRICLVVIGLYLQLLHSFAQTTDTSQYKKRKLSIDEINFVGSYYHQNGNNSAVTGGIGTEKLTDYSAYFECKLIKYNKHSRKIDINANVGIDYYTSASSDKINPYTISSASHEDVRIYPSFTYAVSNEKKGSSMNGGISWSHESDYESFGMAAGLSQKTANRNSEFTAKLQVYLDKVKMILPVELRTAATGGLYGYPNEFKYPRKQRNTLSGSFTFSHVFNQRLQMLWLLDVTAQNGFLGLPFHRVYFNNGKLANEKLPSTRFKIPMAVRGSYFSGDRLIFRGMYRFYSDDWGLTAHTADIELACKITPFFSVSPFYRFYHQEAADYFAPYQQHLLTDEYYTSNYDLSAFSSNFLGAGIRLAPPKGILGIRQWRMIELRYGYYRRTNGLHANIVSIQVKMK